MILWRTLEGAEKCALRDFLREDDTFGLQDDAHTKGVGWGGARRSDHRTHSTAGHVHHSTAQNSWGGDFQHDEGQAATGGCVRSRGNPPPPLPMMQRHVVPSAASPLPNCTAPRQDTRRRNTVPTQACITTTQRP